jgi:hypothetical protein
LNTHLLGSRFNLNPAKTAAARAALIATLLKAKRFDRALQQLGTVPTDPAVIRELRIDGRWQKLHTLRKTNIEAFYLWHHAHLIDGA